MKNQAHPDTLKSLFEECGYPLTDELVLPLCLYVNMLMQWNAAMNLVGTRTWQDTCRLLLIDSFELAHFLPTLNLPDNLHSWDLGSGAGLPGIPLRALWHKGSYIMIESREKRALFLEAVLARLSFHHTSVFHGRVEKYMQQSSQKPDLLLSRAFMPWEKACIFMQPALHDKSIMVFLLKSVPDLSNLPQFTICAHHTYTLAYTLAYTLPHTTGQDTRVIIAIKQSCH